MRLLRACRILPVPPSSPAPDTSPPPATAAHIAAVVAALGPLARNFAIDWVAECASTNTALLDGPPRDDARLHVLVADRQTAGRGRRGRQWLSWDGASLTFSVLWRFPPAAPASAGLSLVVGIALARALEQLGVAGLQLKWPNDVLVNGEKLAGILVDLLSGRGRPQAAVIGIGLNLRLPEGATIPAQGGVTDLARALDTPLPAPATILAVILAELHRLLDTFAAAGFPALRGAWEQRNAFADLPVCISGEKDERHGICAGVDDDGALLLRSADGMERILAGDVSLRPLAGDGA